MISDFIYLEEITYSDYEKKYKCSLPNPDIYGEDNMIECGNIIINENFETGDYTLKINLFDNFKSLLTADVYQRKHFVTTILEIIELKTNIDLLDAEIILNDFCGLYKGSIDNLDEFLWE